ncbi:aspartate/glutamate racemase family protein [Marinivivus vitaminiproducens]|uniref:aspartate/glutamate racemase family protein n=1 Tax=Marinivivus vitaminiproducens TaxID=3035935 RepID=UPI00279D8033|nr:aspartate/glutamate racemase family protein [Geminicoccaceae bacterium SCSIO 64248]
MRIKVINPNTTAGMTATIAEAARGVAAPGTEILAATSPTGPVSIEGHYDEAVAVIGLLEEVRKGEDEGVDGHVVACFGDPGLLACREVARGPVVGIAEAAMHCAALVSVGFSIVTTLGRTVAIAERLVLAYGFERHCRSIRASDLAVLDLEDPASDARRVILDECRKAVEQDGAGAILLGCAGMADLARDLGAELGVPVIDGVAAAVKLVEALVGQGLATSKRGPFAFPLAKPYTGALRHMAPRAR